MISLWLADSKVVFGWLFLVSLVSLVFLVSMALLGPEDHAVKNYESTDGHHYTPQNFMRFLDV